MSRSSTPLSSAPGSSGPADFPLLTALLAQGASGLASVDRWRERARLAQIAERNADAGRKAALEHAIAGIDALRGALDLLREAAKVPPRRLATRLQRNAPTNDNC